MTNNILRAGIIVWCTLFISVTSVFAANVVPVSNFQTSCPGANVNAEVYFPNGSMSQNVTPSDTFWTSLPAFILNGSTDIDVWSGNGGSANCTTGWYRASNYSPWNNQQVNAFYNNTCGLTRNTNPSVPFAQVVFRIGFKTEIGFTNTVVPNQYWYFDPGNPTQNFIGDQRTREWGPVEQHENECLNYYARWCGDGIISNGETCDPAAPGQSPTTCSPTTCTPIAPPPVPGVCSSTINGATYPHTTTAYPSAQCTSGSPSVSIFPTPGTTVSWTCSGTAGGAASPVCTASTLPTPVPGVCSSTINGATYPHTTTAYPSAQCTSGSPSVSTFPTPGTTVSWTCSGTNGGAASPVCTATTLPTPIPGVCNPGATGVQQNPLTEGVCSVGTAASFSAIGTNPTIYTWKCVSPNNGNTDGCTASYAPPFVPQPALSLKKYINTLDAQTISTAPTLTGTAVSATYTIIVSNIWSGAVVPGTTTVSDSLPAGITLSAVPTGAGWTCTGVVGGGAFTCTRTDGLAANSTYPTITVPVSIAVPGTYTNTATVSNSVPTNDSNGPTDNTDPAVVIVVPTPVPTAFDLSIKKYVETNDAQTSTTGVSVASGSGTQYVLRVSNAGPASTSGTTTVVDTLPTGIVSTSVPTGAGWICTVAGQNIVCTTSAVVSAGAIYPDIVVPVRIVATTGTLLNTAYVHNPNETNPCKTDGSMPAGNEWACTKDPKNTDPAYIVVVPTPVAPFDLIVKKYANTQDAQTSASGVGVSLGSVVTYTLRATNVWPGTTTGTTTVSDTFPAGVTVTAVSTSVPWGCTAPSNIVTCTTSAPLAAGMSYPDITILATTTTVGTIVNVSTVSNPDENPLTNLSNDPKNTDPAYIVVSAPIKPFDLQIKKYVNSVDAQTAASGVTVRTGTGIVYVLRAQNMGPGSTTGTTTILDTVPTGLTLSGVTFAAPWVCTATGNTVSCTTSAVVGSGAFYPDISLSVRTGTSTGVYINTATVSNPNENPATNVSIDPKNTDPAVIIVVPAPTPGVCSTTASGMLSTPITVGVCNTGTATGFTATGTSPIVYTWTCTGTYSGATSPTCSASYTPPVVQTFDLQIKKYVKWDDVYASVASTEDYDYNVVVKNIGLNTSTGMTTVIDNLPSPVSLRAVPYGNGWTCTTAGSTAFRCTSTATVPAGSVYPTITIPARIVGGTYMTGGIVNRAFVQNPYEQPGKTCTANNSMPTGTETACTTDLSNSDTATVNVPSPTGYDLGIKKYINTNDDSSVGTAGGTATYTFVVRNYGALSSSGRITVTDIDFASGITLVGVPTGAGWTCSTATGGFSCYTDSVLAADTDSTTISAPVSLAATMPAGTYRNIARVSNAGDPHNSMVCNADNAEYAVNNCNPALLVINPAGRFDLSLLKKVGTSLSDGTLQDRNTAIVGAGVQNVLPVAASGSVVYTFTVKNIGTVASTGTTTVEDSATAGTTLGAVSGAGWTCTTVANTFVCTRTDSLAVGAVYPDIVAYATVVSTAAAGVYSNVATVSNPNDINVQNNVDPANILVVVTPLCSGMSANPGATVPAGTNVTFSCATTGTSTGTVEYRIQCYAGDMSGTYGTGATRVCTYSAVGTYRPTCEVRTAGTTTSYSGSAIGACNPTIQATGGGGSITYYAPTCVGASRVCASYTSLSACTAAGNASSACTTDYAGCMATASPVCTGPGGGGWGGGGGYTPVCGNGILDAGEMCDIGGNGNMSSTTCTSTCTLPRTMFTNPGANPIVDIWVKIPALSAVKLGNSFTTTNKCTKDSAGNIKCPLNENTIVVGKNTSIFSSADVITFGIARKYEGTPLMIEADKMICLSANGGVNLNGAQDTAMCKSIGDMAPSTYVQNINNTRYVVLGKGQYIYPTNCGVDGRGCTYMAATVNNTTEFATFRGASTYPLYTSTTGVPTGGSLTPRSAFTATSGGDINFALGYIDIQMPVRVSSSFASSTAGGTFVSTSMTADTENLVKDFLYAITTGNFTVIPATGTTSTATTTSPVSTVVAPVSTATVTSSDSLNNLLNALPRLNGNDNILVYSGNLTISGDLKLSGVRTVLVQNGTLTISGNITYADSASSWAWIVQNNSTVPVSPDILVAPGVTDLAGVYVSTAGKIWPMKDTSGIDTSSTKVLRVDGTLYANGGANPLISSRTYVYGSNAYNTLTSGIIVNYSNRALVSPPPLLTNYLSQYNVTKVNN